MQLFLVDSVDDISQRRHILDPRPRKNILVVLLQTEALPSKLKPI